MTNTQTRPSVAQADFMLGLVRAGGTYSRFAGVRPAGMATLRRCRVEGWIEPVGGSADRNFEYAITSAGRLALAAADTATYEAALAAATERLAGAAVDALAARGVDAPEAVAQVRETAAEVAAAAERERLQSMVDGIAAAASATPPLDLAALAAAVDVDEADECEGHESLDGASMGATVYCDGSCRRHERPARRPAGPVIDTAIPALMSMTEVAAHHDVSRQAVHKAIMSGKLPAVQVGTTWVVRREVVEAAGQTILIDRSGE